MRKGTTPTFTFDVLDLDLSNAKTIWVIFKQNQTIIKKADDDIDIKGQTLIVRFTQEETLKFNKNDILRVQVRVLTNMDNAYASDIFKIDVNDLLVNEVISE